MSGKQSAIVWGIVLAFLLMYVYRRWQSRKVA